MTKKDFFDRMRQELRMLRGLGQGMTPNPSVNSGYTGAPNGLPRSPSSVMGQYNTGVNTHGVEPNDVDVEQFIQQMGGYPTQLLKPPAPATGASAPAKGEGDYLLQRLFKSLDDETKAAKSATLGRYFDTLQGKSDLRDRALAEAQNSGEFEKQMNREQMDEYLKTAKARLASRGLLNSNVYDALALRKNRDLALLNQKTSEDRSNRLVGLDTALTNNYYVTVAARQDIGPDPSRYIELGMAYGRSGGGQGYGAYNGPTPPAPESAPMSSPGGGISPTGAMLMAAGMQNQLANAYAPAFALANNPSSYAMPSYGFSWTSNAFPHRAG